MALLAQGSGSVLVIHDDGHLLDLLTRLFEARGLRVRLAPTAARALAELKAADVDVVVASWAVAQSGGANIYRAALAQRPNLRGRFVFLAEVMPDQYDRVAEGRCPILNPHELEEILRVVEAAVARIRQVDRSRLSAPELEWVNDDQPTMLLVEDEPVQLMFMVRVFNDLGFAVTPAESGNAAVAQLESGDFDVIVTDWVMDDGSGGDLYDWLLAHRHELASRIVFISGTYPRDFGERAPGRVLIPKGQDSAQLVKTVVGIAQRVRGG